MTRTEGATRSEEFVVDALGKWSDRYMAAGLIYRDIERLKGTIGGWEDWCASFAEIGDEYEARAEAAFDRGDDETGGIHSVRAGLYYHFGSHVWHEDEEERAAAQERAVDLVGRGGAHVDPPIEYLSVPYDGYEIGTHLRVPEKGPDGTPGDSPLVVLIPGLDANKEEQFTKESVFLERGLAILAVDGAAQGETWEHQRMTPEYHRLISTTIDHVIDRDVEGVDTDRLGIYGVSLGGFYSPHVAANDERIDACVGISGPFTVGPVSKYEFGILKEQFQWACKADSLIETDEITEQMTLREDVENLTQPTLIATGSEDTIIKPSESERIAVRAPNAEFRLFEGGNHCAINMAHVVRPWAVDWLRRQIA